MLHKYGAKERSIVASVGARGVSCLARDAWLLLYLCRFQVKYVVWSADMEFLALLGKRSVMIVDTLMKVWLS